MSTNGASESLHPEGEEDESEPPCAMPFSCTPMADYVYGIAFFGGFCATVSRGYEVKCLLGLDIFGNLASEFPYFEYLNFDDFEVWGQQTYY